MIRGRFRQILTLLAAAGVIAMLAAQPACADIPKKDSKESGAGGGAGGDRMQPHYSVFLGRQLAVYFARNVKSAVQFARKQDRPLLVFTSTPGSGGDDLLAAEVFSRPSVAREIRRFVAVRLDVVATQHLIKGALSTHPVLYTVDPRNGRLLAEPVVGYFTADEVVKLLDEALQAFGRSRLMRHLDVASNPNASPDRREQAVNGVSIYSSANAYDAVKAIALDGNAPAAVRAAAIEALVSMGRTEAVGTLIEFLGSEDAVVRTAAVKALASQAVDDLQLTIEQLCSVDRVERAHAAKAINELVPDRLAQTPMFWQQATEKQQIRAIRALQRHAAGLKQQLRRVAGLDVSPTRRRSARKQMVSDVRTVGDELAAALTLEIVGARDQTVELTVLRRTRP